jgi:SAM-dependent methyltransferase
MTDDRHPATLDSSAAAVKSGQPPELEHTAMAMVRTIVDVARALGRSVPPPRGAPYFCLDTDAAYDLRVLEAFSARGIFRKYELALDVGSGFGGRARWLATRSGCRVVGVDARVHVVAAARALNTRAHLDEQVGFQVGRLDCLPFRSRVFTHVWVVDPADDAALAGMLAEAFRVLRPGAHFALQCARPSPPPEILAGLQRIGFIEVDTRASPLTGPAEVFRLAASRLRVALGEGTAAELPPPVATCVQIFARRPA